MTSNFINQFGFDDDEFTEQEDPVKWVQCSAPPSPNPRRSRPVPSLDEIRSRKNRTLVVYSVRDVWWKKSQIDNGL